MKEAIEESSPLFKARMAGVFWLLTIITGMFAFVVGGKYVVSGDAAATAANILAHEFSFRLAGAANLIATLCYLAVTLLVYVLLKPVNKNIALLGVFFSLIGCAAGTASILFFLAPVRLLKSAQTAFTIAQLQMKAVTLLSIRATANDIALVFFALHLFTIGYLIRRSTFLPRFLAVLLFIAGICYLTNSFATFLALPFKAYLLPLVGLGGLGGEGALTLWFLVKGVNVQRWNEQVEAMNYE